MSDGEGKSIVEIIKSAIDHARGYADHFGWAFNRDLEELGVVELLSKALDAENKLFFSEIKIRGRGNDPPDCEAKTNIGKRLAIEVTELVSGEAIRDYKKGFIFKWAKWSRESFLTGLQLAINKKDTRYSKLKEPPYPGGYLLVIYTSEPSLNQEVVQRYLLNHKLSQPTHINYVFLILRYEPKTKKYPYFELIFDN
ncbi:MAG: hypothetical protein AB2715_06870 [Candidatus Thiodiazotropha sp.]